MSDVASNVVKAVEALVARNEYLVAKLASIEAAVRTLDKKRGYPTMVTRNGKPGPKVRAKSGPKESAKARGRKPLFTNEVAANMAQAKRDGITLAEIAKTYGCTVQTASRTIDRLDNGARS